MRKCLMSNTRNVGLDIGSLHKHWIIDDTIREFIVSPIQDVKFPVESKNGLLEAEVSDFSNINRASAILPVIQMYSMFLRLQVWYSLLYVVIEGYKKLNLQDDNLDSLLNNDSYIQLLRKFRNATFHYQEQPFPEKIEEFLVENDSEIWVHKVNDAFKSFFETHMMSKRKDIFSDFSNFKL